MTDSSKTLFASNASTFAMLYLHENERYDFIASGLWVEKTRARLRLRLGNHPENRSVMCTMSGLSLRSLLCTRFEKSSLDGISDTRESGTCLTGMSTTGTSVGDFDASVDLR